MLGPIRHVFAVRIFAGQSSLCFFYIYFCISLPTVNIFLNQRPNILKPVWKWFSTERLFIRWQKFQTNRPLKILSLRRKYDCEVKVKNNSEYRTKIYLDRKRSSFWVVNGENILSSAWKTRIYPRDKNHWELTERRMITTKQLLVQAQRFMRNWSATTISSWVTNLTTHVIDVRSF